MSIAAAPTIRPIESTVPVICFMRCSSRAPYACPMSTEAPVDKPMRNEIRKNSSGKNAEIAASAFTPSSRPTKMLFRVLEADCSTLLSINGIRKMRKWRHIGRDSSKIFGPRRGCGRGGGRLLVRNA